MPAAVTHMPNEVANVVVFAGRETEPGVPAAATHRWTGTYTASRSAALVQSEETTGGYDRLLTPRRAPSTFAGTYGVPLTYENFPDLMRYGLKSGSVGVSDGETVPGYLYEKIPDFSADDIDTATIRWGAPGNGWMNTGVRFNEFTIAIDALAADGAWMLSSNLFLLSHKQLPGYFDGLATGGSLTTIVMTGAAWTVNQWAGAFVTNDFGSNAGPVRQIVSNTADTLTLSSPLPVAAAAGDIFRISALLPAGIPIERGDTIAAAGTKVFIDHGADAIGTTQVKGRMISSSITVANNLSTKRFLEDPLDEVNPRTGRGGRRVSGSLTMEHDHVDEHQQWEDLTDLKLRLEKEGPIIDATATPTPTRKLAQIDINRMIWDVITPATRENNLTATYAFVAYLDDTDPILRMAAVNTLPTLP